MPSPRGLDAVIPRGLSAEDTDFLAQWLTSCGDAATLAALRGRIRAILRLQQLHPAHPPLATLVDDADFRRVLLAKPRSRGSLLKGLRRRLSGA